MTAETLLTRLHRRGVRFRVDGDKLRWRAPERVITPADLAQLRDNKAEVIAILQDAEADALEERAAIMEYDAGLPRAEAERLALAEFAPRPHHNRRIRPCPIMTP